MNMYIYLYVFHHCQVDISEMCLRFPVVKIKHIDAVAALKIYVSDNTSRIH